MKREDIEKLEPIITAIIYVGERIQAAVRKEEANHNYDLEQAWEVTDKIVHVFRKYADD